MSAHTFIYSTRGGSIHPEHIRFKHPILWKLQVDCPLKGNTLIMESTLKALLLESKIHNLKSEIESALFQFQLNAQIPTTIELKTVQIRTLSFKEPKKEDRRWKFKRGSNHVSPGLH